MTKAEFIKTFIKKNGYTKTSFCKACKMSLGTLDRFLLNHKTIRLSTAVKLVKFLNVKLDFFINLD